MSAEKKSLPLDQTQAFNRWSPLLRLDLLLLLAGLLLLPHFVSFSQQELLVFTLINGL